MIFSLLIQLALGALLTRIIYLCFFHPLSIYPGPFLARFTNLWYCLHLLLPLPSRLHLSTNPL